MLISFRQIFATCLFPLQFLILPTIFSVKSASLNDFTALVGLKSFSSTSV